MASCEVESGSTGEDMVAGVVELTSIWSFLRMLGGNSLGFSPFMCAILTYPARNPRGSAENLRKCFVPQIITGIGKPPNSTLYGRPFNRTVSKASMNSMMQEFPSISHLLTNKNANKI